MNPVLSSFDQEFLALDSRSRELLSQISEDLLFTEPRQTPSTMAIFSCGEYILRSAAMVEMSFGGITTRLWDDPFEWTLPEHLASRSEVCTYLDSVEETRNRGFSFIASDSELVREIPAPRQQRTLAAILAGTLSRAAHYQGRAFAVFQMVSDARLPRL